MSNNSLMIFEDNEVKMIIEEDGVILFELYTTGMALGHVKYNSAGKAYPRKERIDRDVKNAEISTCVRGGHKYLTEEQLYDFMLEAKTDKCKAFRKWVTHEVLPNIRKGNYVMLSNKDKARLEVLNANNDLQRIDAMRKLEDIAHQEGYVKGYDEGYDKCFEEVKNERVTPLCEIAFIANNININSFNVGALNRFLVLRGLGTLEKVNKYYKFKPNDKFEKAIISNGWASYTNHNKTTFKFYKAFAEFINENMEIYKEDLLKAKELYDKVLEYRKAKIPF